MISEILAFLVMLNPFALFLYLEPIRKDLDEVKFFKVILKATFISFSICLIFFFFGNFILNHFLNIHFESFRIFGGIVIFSFAYYFVVGGKRALIFMKEDLDDLASEIALPFMVGAGTISLSILLSQNNSNFEGVFSLVLIFLVNFLILMFLTHVRKKIDKKKMRVAFDKNMAILLRLNGFFIGAIGIEMIVEGVTKLFFS
jgi:multiple antibiotic resistance protein